MRIKYLVLLAAAASALALPAKAADKHGDIPSTSFGWSGFYIGAHGGIAAGDSGYGVGPAGGPPLVTFGVTAGGGLVGGQAGYNWQFGNFVVGGVADIAWSGYQANLSGAIVPVPIGFAATSNLNYLATLRARAGYAFDRTLVYATSGLAYGSTTQTLTALGATLFTATQSRVGWTLGAGFEHAITDRLTVGGEYAYVDLGTRDVFNNGVLQFTESTRFHTVKAFANYHFGATSGASVSDRMSPASFQWDGFYAGVHGGLATGNSAYGIGLAGGPALLTLGVSAGGGLLGAQAGYSWQSGNLVFGGVADIAWSGYRANLSAGLGPIGVAATSTVNYLATVRAKGGYALDRALVYAHAGIAFGSTTQNITALGAPLFTATQSRVGWTAGAGIEYGITERLSVGTEYSYVDLGTRDAFNNGVIQITEATRFHSVKALVNLHF